MPGRRILIIPAEVAQKLDDNRGDMSRSGFLDLLINRRLRKEVDDKEPIPQSQYATKEDVLSVQRDMKMLLKSLLDSFLSYGLETSKQTTESDFEETGDKIGTVEESLRDSLDSPPQGYCIYSPDGSLLYANQALLGIYGYESIDEFKNTVEEQRLPKEALVMARQGQAALQRGRSESSPTLDIVRKDGQLRHLAAIAKPVLWNGEEQTQIVCRDITEPKPIEEALRESEERFRKAFEAGPMGMALASLDDRFVLVNQQFCKMMGYSEGEFISMTFSKITHPDYVGKDDEAEAKLMKGEISFYQTERKYVRRDKAEIWGNLTRTVIRDKNGNAIYSLAVVEDITARKKAEDTLDRLLTAVEASGEVVFMTNTDGIITYINPEFTRLYGYLPDEIVNLATPRILESASHNEEAYEPFWEGLLSREIVERQVVNKTKDGRLVHVWSSSNPILDRQGNIAGFLAIQRDMTQQKKLQETLLAQDRLASIGQLVSGVAHELGTPLASIIIYSQLLQQKKLPEDATGDLKVIIEEARRATGIVRDLVTFARRQPATKSEVQLNEQITRVLGLLSHEHKTSNIQTIVQLDPGLPTIIGNSSQMQQVFFNIINNAEQAILGASDCGVITVTTEREGSNVKATFADDGPGISPEDMQRLFTPFFTTKEVGKGTGLGLSICRGIVAEHGGRIYAESKPGEGATFVVELPASETNCPG